MKAGFKFYGLPIFRIDGTAYDQFGKPFKYEAIVNECILYFVPTPTELYRLYIDGPANDNEE